MDNEQPEDYYIQKNVMQEKEDDFNLKLQKRAKSFLREENSLNLEDFHVELRKKKRQHKLHDIKGEQETLPFDVENLLIKVPELNENIYEDYYSALLLPEIKTIIQKSIIDQAKGLTALSKLLKKKNPPYNNIIKSEVLLYIMKTDFDISLKNMVVYILAEFSKNNQSTQLIQNNIEEFLHKYLNDANDVKLIQKLFVLIGNLSMEEEQFTINIVEKLNYYQLLFKQLTQSDEQDFELIDDFLQSNSAIVNQFHIMGTKKQNEKQILIKPAMTITIKKLIDIHLQFIDNFEMNLESIYQIIEFFNNAICVRDLETEMIEQILNKDEEFLNKILELSIVSNKQRESLALVQRFSMYRDIITNLKIGTDHPMDRILSNTTLDTESNKNLQRLIQTLLQFESNLGNYLASINQLQNLIKFKSMIFSKNLCVVIRILYKSIEVSTDAVFVELVNVGLLDFIMYCLMQRDGRLIYNTVKLLNYLINKTETEGTQQIQFIQNLKDHNMLQALYDATDNLDYLFKAEMIKKSQKYQIRNIIRILKHKLDENYNGSDDTESDSESENVN